MKKTLIALMLMAALGSQVKADLVPETWTFGTTAYGQSYNGGSYKGIAFSLATDSDRYTADAPLYRADFGVTLNSITILARNNNDNDIPTTLALIVVDNEGTLLGVSSSHTHDPMQLNGLQYTRMASTFTFDDETAPVTLNSSGTYYAYFVSQEIADELESDFVLTASNFGTTVSAATLFAYQGKSPQSENPYIDTAGHWGLQGALFSTASSDYVPNVKVVVTAPEPATATLGLLALAGLAARRRRH